jgi:hypothetical protein
MHGIAPPVALQTTTRRKKHQNCAQARRSMSLREKLQIFAYFVRGATGKIRPANRV